MSNATPSDDGYGAPGTTIFGDANNDGVFDDKNALLGLPVQKYGRTTKLTKVQITGINATLTICYEVIFIFCTKSARFVDQLIIEPGAFSGGGDSGSLIVTDDANRNPVARFRGRWRLSVSPVLEEQLQRQPQQQRQRQRQRQRQLQRQLQRQKRWKNDLADNSTD